MSTEEAASRKLTVKDMYKTCLPSVYPVSYHQWDMKQIL